MNKQSNEWIWKSGFWIPILIFAGACQPALGQTSTPSSISFESGQTQSVLIKSALVKVAQSVDVPVEQAGVLVELLVREGQTIKKGDLIGRLKDTELQIRLERAKLEHEIATMTAASEVDIQYASKSRDVAIAELMRSEQANQRVANSVPLARIEKQRLEKDRTILQLEKAERDFRIANLKSKLVQNEIRLAQEQLQQADIRSPTNGVVVSVGAQAGEWVEPSQTLVQIVRVDRLRIEGFVPVDTARSIRVGSPVQISFPQGWINETIPGEVIFIGPEANPVNLNVQVWAEVDNADGRLIPGLRGDVLIEQRQ